MALTEDDRFIISRAREMTGPGVTTGEAWQRLAKEVLRQLADLAERLGGQDSATVLAADIERAAALAKAMTERPLTTAPGDGEWSVQDVLNVALYRGLDALEKSYLGGEAVPCAACGHSRTEHLTRSPSRPEPYFCAQCSCRQYQSEATRS